MQKVGVLGSAVVGQTLAQGFKTHGYEVRIGSRTPAKLTSFTESSGVPAGTFEAVGGWGELLVLAVHGTAADSALSLAGAANHRGKIVVDTTNPIAAERPTMFFCGNDADAKATVAEILRQFGWDPADMGTAVAARAIEPLCQLWCIPGFRENHWTHAFKLLWD